MLSDVLHISGCDILFSVSQHCIDASLFVQTMQDHNMLRVLSLIIVPERVAVHGLARIRPCNHLMGCTLFYCTTPACCAALPSEALQYLYCALHMCSYVYNVL